MKNTVVTLQKQKHEHDKITMVTAYDYTTAKIMDESGVNTILVGDSLGFLWPCPAFVRQCHSHVRV